MDNEEELKNTELQQQENMEGEGDYDDEEFVEDNEAHVEGHMEGEGEMYDQEEHEDMQNPYNQNDAIRNTFYPAQNPIMAGGYAGGALRPVSANVMKNRGMKGKKGVGLARGMDDDFDVRTRPRHFMKDKEGLYDDAIKLKKANNNYKNDNLKLKTRVKKLEAELMNQQREMDEYIMNQNQGRMEMIMNNSYMKTGGSHITQSLKNLVRDLRAEVKKKDEELNKVKRSLKSTNIQELEVEMKLYVDE